MSDAPRTRIKICGITRLADAEAAAEAGADALGLNFSDQSARRVDVAPAAEIARGVDGRLIRVGVFVDPDPREVGAVLDQVSLDLLQFHGEESAGLCSSFGLPYMKAHRIADRLDERAIALAYPDSCCHLLDAFVVGQPGGTGQRFDWTLVPRETPLKYVIAGGLTVENVGQAVTRMRPFGVDVSGGVEAGEKGIKDHEAVRRFVRAVRAADASS